MSPHAGLPYVPLRLLRGPHAQTIVATFVLRRPRGLPPAEERLFEVAPRSRLRAECHWHADPRAHPTLVLLHGLEGSSGSPYMRGLADLAFRSGFNAIRVNQRTCGRTERLSLDMYHSGRSGDPRRIVEILAVEDRLPELFLAGYSLGGNVALKLAGEYGADVPAALRGVAAVSPTLDLDACVRALERRRNRIYERHFVRSLKRRVRRQARAYPDLYSAAGLRSIRTVRAFDDRVTAPLNGFRDASDYYDRCSARRVAAAITVPTLIVSAKDDPFVPHDIFEGPEIAANRHITLLIPERGGHCGFIAATRDRDERHWAEARIIEFFRARSAVSCRSSSVSSCTDQNHAARVVPT